MRAAEFFARGPEIDRQIKSKQQKIRLLHDRLSVRTTHFTGMPGGGERKDWTDILATIDHEKRELAKLQALRKRIWEEMRLVFSRMDSVKLRELLELRYINLLDWDDIAEVMSYSLRYLFKLQVKAFASADAILESMGMAKWSEVKGEHDVEEAG